MQNNSERELELLDIMVIISFVMQMDNMEENKKYIKNVHLRLDSLEDKLDKILKKLEINT